jgi:formylglycine-generating enzyme required for sulfatase activity
MRTVGVAGLVVFGAASLLMVGLALAEKPKRGVAVVPQVAAGSLPITGDYWALIIGIDQYRHVPKLQSAVKDAQAVREVLVQRYGFGRDHVIELINGQATREGIENALYQVRKKTGPNDSVFIYYAGHGQIDQEDQIGYWVPVEGKAQSPGTFISNARIRDEIGRMKAKHVYLVADSCFSGTLFASGRALPPLNDKFFQRLYANKSRWGLTSGMNEPVTDQGKDGHSMFAYFLLKLLKENEDPYLVPSHIYDQIAPLIGRNTDQQPRSEPLQNAGDEGGQFVFRLASISGGPLPSPPPRAGEGRPALSQVEGVEPSASLGQLQQELQALEAQEQQVEERAKQAELQKQIEEKKKRLEEKKKKLEVASLPTPSLPRQTGKEITGKDGAPMALVPAGEFLYGDNNQRMSLPAFYMDKYEVTTRLYAIFMQATGHEAPGRWNEVSKVNDGDRPVIGVAWHDADAYCRHYGKRLPTEEEWEKAARGTDGRKYPWGNEEPNRSLASYDRDGNRAWQGYSTLATVESYETGKSPYGLYNMAGNVWEWTSSDYDSSNKVYRGGSWGDSAAGLHASIRPRRTPTDGANSLGFRCAQDVPKSESAVPMQVASSKPYGALQESGKEITGKDSAPMVLVPAGEFLYGDDNQRMSLPAFYMDKFEVTAKLYAKFIKDTSRGQPSDWSQQVALVGSGDRPVVNVTWDDADAYCRHYGKRLPTEEEWEKAARGTDGRKYPWGNEEPSSRHALFYTRWNGGYGTLATVESYEAGKSPYGLYHMAGNVWEWTSSDFHSSRKVLRGGSWSDYPSDLSSTSQKGDSPSSMHWDIGFRCAQDASK